MKKLSENKQVKYKYQLQETIEAGIVLTGAEVKSTRAGKMNIKDAYVKILNSSNGRPEAWLINAYIPRFPNTIEKNYEPTRTRKMLLNKSELRSLIGKSSAGYHIIPTEAFLKNHLIKINISLAKSLVKHDKRELIKKREVETRIRKITNQKRLA